MERKKRGQTAASLASGHPGESSRIVTGGVSGANPMTGFKVGMGNNNTQSQSKVPLSNTPHLHLLPRGLSGRRSRLRSFARSEFQQFPVLFIQLKSLLGGGSGGNLECDWTIFLFLRHSSSSGLPVVRGRGAHRGSPPGFSEAIATESRAKRQQITSLWEETAALVLLPTAAKLIVT